jgi:arylsulfatase A-like enzyme
MKFMDRRAVLKGIGSTVAAMGLGQPGARAETSTKRRPNVIFILPDEWRGQALGCMGNPDVRTPHLDGLAREGVLMRNTLANTPVCCPARSVMLTGTYASKTGMVANDLRLNEAEITLGDLFGRAGYRTAYIGKWHLDGGPREPGFVPPGRRRHGFEFWAANECNHNYFYNWYFRDADVPIVTEKYEPEVWTDLAVEFLHESQQPGQKSSPFFLMLAIGAPHDPYVAPLEYMDLYDPAKLTMEPNWAEGVRGGGRKEIAGYYAAISAIDDQVGRLLRTLRELDLEENTIVFFSSDHGNMLGSQGKVLKRKPWEESIRVPGILRCPGLIPAGRRTDALVSHVDFAPTLLGLCGLPVPANMQGQDLSGVVTGRSEKGPDAAFFQIFGPYHAGGVEAGWRGIRTERYMYARLEVGPWVLYDLENDPYEIRNLAGDPAAAVLRNELDGRLTAWMNQAGDSWKLDWSVPVDDGGRLYTYRTFHTIAQYLEWARKHPNLTPGGGGV